MTHQSGPQSRPFSATFWLFTRQGFAKLPDEQECKWTETGIQSGEKSAKAEKSLARRNDHLG